MALFQGVDPGGLKFLKYLPDILYRMFFLSG